MNTSAYVGRIGGLAVALGVGAAVNRLGMRESMGRYARVDVVGADSSSTDGFEADRRILGHRGRDVGAGQEINDEAVGPEEMDDDTLEILTPDAGLWAEDA